MSPIIIRNDAIDLIFFAYRDQIPKIKTADLQLLGNYIVASSD